ncbi:zinc finger CW-type PWWP domain protein 2 isoform X2 [Callithrix jacchus]
MSSDSAGTLDVLERGARGGRRSPADAGEGPLPSNTRARPKPAVGTSTGRREGKLCSYGLKGWIISQPEKGLPLSAGSAPGRCEKPEVRPEGAGRAFAKLGSVVEVGKCRSGSAVYYTSREPPRRDGAGPRDARRRRRRRRRSEVELCWIKCLMDKENLDGKIEYCNYAMDSSGENMYVNKMWIQCENENCLKWRLLSNEDAAKVDHNEPWYCFMNTDSRYNNCSISEEDFPEESQLHQSGFKIVYSQLPLGSLVLVKLQNWPSQKNVRRKRNGIKAHYKKHVCSMDILMNEDWKCAACQNNKKQISKNNIEKTKPKFRKRKRKATLTYSSENVCYNDALSKENMVVSETEILLKELEQMLQQAVQPTTTAEESEEGHGEEVNTGEKLSKCSPEAPAGSPFENHYEEDYLVIDGIKLKAGECIEDITNKFKEIDALMSEF